MIKVTVGEQKTQSEVKKYPCIKIASKSTVPDRVVLFVEPGVGVCLIEGGLQTSPVGELFESWDEDKFTDYNKPITLQNIQP